MTVQCENQTDALLDCLLFGTDAEDPCRDALMSLRPEELVAYLRADDALAGGKHAKRLEQAFLEVVVGDGPAVALSLIEEPLREAAERLRDRVILKRVLERLAARVEEFAAAHASEWSLQ